MYFRSKFWLIVNNVVIFSDLKMEIFGFNAKIETASYFNYLLL